MRGVTLFSALCLLGLNLVSCYPYAQQPIVVPPHLLRTYLDQRQQERARNEGAPIYEQESQGNTVPQYLQRESSQPQYVPQYAQQAQSQYVTQPQSQYVVQGRPQQLKRPRPRPEQVKQSLDEEDPADYDPNPSYQFGFDVNDDHNTNYQNRQEERQGGVIKGSYSVVDSDGFIRTVTYTADPKEGFKAEVVRKPTDIVVKVPTPAPQPEHQSRPLHQYQLEEGSQGHRQVRPQPHQQQQLHPQQQQQQYYRYQ